MKALAWPSMVEVAVEPPASDRSCRNMVWPDAPGVRFEARYGAVADELVVRWDGFVPVTAASDFFDEYDAADIGVIIDWRTGHVIGVNVYPLLHGAIPSFPHWAALSRPSPPPEAVAALVADVRRVFNRFGVERGDEQ